MRSKRTAGTLLRWVSRRARFARTSSVGRTQSIGIEWQRSVPTCSARYLDLLAGDDLAANQTVTFLIQKTPWPELIEPSQRFQLIYFR
ncbi:MAG: hypothetical protein DME60_00520 [Verrucomicrobia bacterium]|nr:MAG: hypothetical protein DME60_00520 [Verrucomicrobiota bacterium]